MIVVDTSVWIDHLNDRPTAPVLRLREIVAGHLALLLVGDLILCEVLQGLTNDREARLVEQALRRCTVAAMVTPDLASQAATHYRALRGRGRTIRKTIDLLIGTFCIAHDHMLLHNDRDFDPMQEYLGLLVVAC